MLPGLAGGVVLVWKGRSMLGLSVGSLNVCSGGFNGYDNVSKHPSRLEAIQAAVKAMNASVVGLIDTYRWVELFSAADLRRLFGYARAFSSSLACEVVDSRVGLTVLGDERLIECVPVRIYDRDCLQLVIDTRNGLLIVYVAYFTSWSAERRRCQAQALISLANEHPETPTLIVQDGNCVRPEYWPWPVRAMGRTDWYRRWASNARLPLKELWQLPDTSAVALLRAAGFRDELAAAGQLGKTFHRRVLGRFDVGFPVDYCWSRGLKVQHCEVLQGPVFAAATDHNGVKAWL